MAGRPPKSSIDFAGWAVDIFDNEPKIDKLMDAQGCVGFTIYFFLCQRAYGSNGYFYPWCYDDAATTARKIGGGAGAKSVEETVRCCLQIGLFDKGLFDGWKILTSRGIQKRYMPAALARTNKSVIREFWLLTKEESEGLITLPKNRISNVKMPISPPHNSIINPHSKVKESIADNLSSPVPVDKNIFSDDSKEMQLAILLSSEIKKNNPTWILRGGIQAWCDVFRLMLNRDKRDYKDVASMIKFCQWDEFWRTNILSPSKLRKQYDMLTLKREEARKKHEQYSR